jgi:hypothetical protein
MFFGDEIFDELVKGFLVKEKRVLKRIEKEEMDGNDIYGAKVTGGDRT